MSEYDFGLLDSVEMAPENMAKRLPAILLLDTSGSMSGSPIDAMNDGLTVLAEEFDPETGDPRALRSVEFALVTFGHHGVQMVNLQTGMSSTRTDDAFVEAIDYRAPVLSAGGGTPMGEAMDLAFKILNERKAYYAKHSIPSFLPWIFLISDGEPNSGWEPSAERAISAQQNRDALVFSIGVQGANMQKLQAFSEYPAIPLIGLKFRELFKFISDSATQASASSPTEKTTGFDIQAMKSFSQIPLD